jgi:hypothetical protein
MPLKLVCFVDYRRMGYAQVSLNLDGRPSKREEKVIRRHSSILMRGKSLKKTIALKTGLFIL